MKPQPQMLGQLPIECVTPGPVFDKVGGDYAGPVLTINVMCVSQLLLKLTFVFRVPYSQGSSS